MPKVSVVIPCYNHGQFVDEAVSSVLDQTFDDVEIVVVNDGSTDPATMALLGAYDRPKTRVIHTENQGLPSARNAGIRNAGGEYILPLDADDRIGREYIAEAVRVLDADPDVGIVYCEAAFFGARKGFWDLPEFEMSRMLVSNIIFCSGVFRKGDWEQVSGYNANMVYGWEDWDFWLSILELGRKVHRIPRLLFHYRVAENSMVGGMTEEKQAVMRLTIHRNHPALYGTVSNLDLVPKTAQLYVDAGQGLDERTSVTRPITKGPNRIEFDIGRFGPIRAMRLDPANDRAVLTIGRIALHRADGAEISPSMGTHNALHRRDDRFVFDTTDPWIELDVPEGDVRTVQVEAAYEAFGVEIYRHLVQQEHAILMDQAERIGTLRDRLDLQQHLIAEKNTAIAAKDAHISHLESELGWIKSLPAWRFINLYRLAGKAVSTLRREGWRQMAATTRNYLQARKTPAWLRSSDGKYQRWMDRNQITESQKAAILQEIGTLKYQPFFSLIMPVYNVDRPWLEKALDSVCAQLYPHWELCIVDDASTREHVRQVLDRYRRKDGRIHVRHLEKGRGISGASNAALALATGEFIGLMDHDDELSIDALYQNARLLNRELDADIIYSDEDKIGTDGKRCHPFFKPDWSPDYFRALNYISHFTVIRKSLVDRIGGFRSGVEGAQDYDLVLRASERTNRIHHIPKVLYHWRMIPGSTADSLENKMDASLAGKKALAEHLERLGQPAQVSIVRPTNYRVSYDTGRTATEQPDGPRTRCKRDAVPLISIIIPFKDRVDLLRHCVDSILDRASAVDYELLLVSNNSERQETFDYVRTLTAANGHIALVELNIPFNFSAINNRAVEKAGGRFLLFLNNDTEIRTPNWLETLLGYAQLPHAGAVGVKMVFPDGRIQHAGITLGVMGAAWNSFWEAPKDHLGYFHNLILPRNCSAVSAACMMVEREKFQSVGGFNEELAIGFNDVDLCLRLLDRGLFNIYIPYVEIMHDESASRGRDDIDPEKRERNRLENEYLHRTWGRYIENDPFYNPHLSRKTPYFDIDAA